MKCPFCGKEFEPREKGGCSGCPLSGGCRKICCPNCGYEIPREPGLLKALKERWMRIGSGQKPKQE